MKANENLDSLARGTEKKKKAEHREKLGTQQNQSQESLRVYKQTKTHKLIHTDNRMVAVRGEERWGRTKRVTGVKYKVTEGD